MKALTKHQYRLRYAKKLIQQELFLDKVVTALSVKSKTLQQKYDKLEQLIKE